MGTKRTPCWGLLDMRVISSANMSRLFRALLLLMSILFAALFVYQNIKSSRHPGSRVAQDRPTLSRKVLTRREKVPNYPFRTGAKDQTNRWTRVRKKTIETDNRTAGIANGRLEELKRGLDITKSKTREIVERMKGSVRLRNAFAGIENEQTTEARKLQEIGDWKKAFAGIENEQKTEARKLQDIGNGKKAFAGIENEQTTEARKLQDIGDGEKVDNDSSNDDEYDDYSKSIIKDKSKQPIFIVILARMRTGSTLIGEIFNQNPSLFFIFEPLISIDPLLRSGEVDVSQHKNISTDLLLGYSRCEFQENLTHAWLKWNGGSVRSNKIIPLCKKPAGPKSRYRNCTLITVNDLRTICRQSHQRVCMKTIRADLDYFKPLVNAGINVKIIHLVRDPRGTANSRRLYYNFSRPKLPPKSFRQGNIPGRWKGKLEALGLLGNYPDHVVHTIPRLCQWTRDSILQVQNEKPSWLRKRYKLVRYEDFALDPLRMAHQIYDFVGIEYPLAVKEWIVSNTRDNDNRSVKFFSTHKNSIETASRWRQSLLPTQVRKVEAICSEMMKLLGYKKVINSMDLTNNNVILMEPLPIPDTF